MDSEFKKVGARGGALIQTLRKKRAWGGLPFTQTTRVELLSINIIKGHKGIKFKVVGEQPAVYKSISRGRLNR